MDIVMDTNTETKTAVGASVPLAAGTQATTSSSLQPHQLTSSATVSTSTSTSTSSSVSISTSGPDLVPMPGPAPVAHVWFELETPVNASEPELYQGDVSEYICSICRLIFAGDACSTPCGHCFCAPCIGTWLASHPTCPCCKELCQRAMLIPLPHVPRTLNGKTVKCPCCSDWTGSRSSLLKHCDECPRAKLRCLRCAECFERKSAEEHRFQTCRLRDFRCEACGVVVGHDAMARHQLQKCTAIVRDCPNTCGAKQLSFDDLQKHLRVCSQATMTCFCGRTVLVRESDAHLNDEALCGDHLRGLRIENAALHGKVKDLSVMMETLRRRLLPHPGYFCVAKKQWNGEAQLQPGDLIDAKDCEGTWLPARVMGVLESVAPRRASQRQGGGREARDMFQALTTALSGLSGTASNVSVNVMPAAATASGSGGFDELQAAIAESLAMVMGNNSSSTDSRSSARSSSDSVSALSTTTPPPSNAAAPSVADSATPASQTADVATLPVLAAWPSSESKSAPPGLSSKAGVRVHFLGYGELSDEDVEFGVGRLAPVFEHSFLSVYDAWPSKFVYGQFAPLQPVLRTQTNYAGKVRLERTEFHTQGGWSCCLNPNRAADSCATL